MPSRPGPIDALARLPLFFDLDGRAVLVAGEKDAVRWKIDLLLAAGATVHLFTPAPPAGLAVNRRLILTGRRWSADDPVGHALALLASDDDDEAARFRTACRAVGVPCNVIDRPAFCDFQFGAVVNRSPIVIAIATEGTVPVLAQAIRARIEAILPDFIGRWAVLARRWRDRVRERLTAPADRRRFWQHFADLAFSRSPNTDADTGLLESWLDEAAPASVGVLGEIIVIATGTPGADLVTLGALQALQTADHVVFAESSRSFADLARREAGRRLAEGPAALDIARDLAGKGAVVVLLRPAAATAAPTATLIVEKLSVTVENRA